MTREARLEAIAKIIIDGYDHMPIADLSRKILELFDNWI